MNSESACQVTGKGVDSEGCLEREEEGTGGLGRGRIIGDGLDVREEESVKILVWKFGD